MSKEVYALADGNSFFCSCERVFNPALENKPVIVLSNNDGCAVSRTDEAKKLGIEMAAPYFKIKDIIEKHDVKVFSSNFSLYGDLSTRMMNIFADFVPDMEVYSVDEAFLSLTGIKDLDAYAREIRFTVKKQIGIPVSIGIAHTKVLAKMANNIAKKQKKLQGVLDFTRQENQDLYFRRFPVGELWGVGRRSAIKLEGQGIKSALDLKRANEKFIGRLLGVNGRRVLSELNGESCADLTSVRPNKKEICTSRSFAKCVTNLNDLKEAVANHISTASGKLRQQKSICKEVRVFIRTSPHRGGAQHFDSGCFRLLSGTSATNKLIEKAHIVLEKIYKPNFEYKKCGVYLTDIHQKSDSQLDFFGAFDSIRDDNFMQAIDKINNTYGRHTMKFGACGIDKRWRMLSQMRTPCYTTKWSDLKTVS